MSDLSNVTNLYLAWFTALLVLALPNAALVWGFITGVVKPATLKLAQWLTGKWGQEWSDKLMRGLYIVLAFGIGFGVAAYIQVMPFAMCPACPTWFSTVPIWVGYLLYAALVAIGETGLNVALGILKALAEWLGRLGTPAAK